MVEENLVRLFYISKFEMSPKEFVGVWARGNRDQRTQLTGWFSLDMDHHQVTQTIEGPRDMVHSLWDDFKTDPNHSVQVQFFVKIGKRKYKKYT